jgi:very-short-patch-repair endonuclease
MNKSKKCYEILSDKEKLSLLNDLYINQHKSFADIAEIYDTYPNKVRRDAKKLNVTIRDKSEAQKNALSTGKHKHPTKGKTRPDSVKQKIGSGVMESWEQLTDTQLKNRKQKAKDNWDKLSQEEKENMQNLATEAVRHSSKTGSKLEKFILQQLMKDGYYVEFHKEQTLVNTKLQIDLFLPKMNIAIEIDGPSHFLPVWGDDALAKNITYDQKKEGLILGKGWHLIRIKQLRDFSKSRSSILYNKLLDAIDKLSNTNNSTPTKYTIED